MDYYENIFLDYFIVHIDIMSTSGNKFWICLNETDDPTGDIRNCWNVQFFEKTSETIAELSKRIIDIELIIGTGDLGNVVGPTSAMDNEIVLFDGTSGELIKGSGVIADSGNQAV